MSEMSPPGPVDLRRGVLAVSVLHDVDVEPDSEGVALPGDWPVRVSWQECRSALAGHDPESEIGRRRLADHLQARRWCGDLTTVGLWDLLRPVGLPVEHALHPGLDWVRERVMGDALDLGFGAAGLDEDDPDRVVLVPAEALADQGIDPAVAWVDARDYLEDMGRLAVRRLRRDRRGQLRPMGDCDALTLLGARSLRTALAREHGGLASAVVPMRRRGWTDLSLIDPAFGPAAAAATEEAERGFDRPVLLTADEITQVPKVAPLNPIALRDDSSEPWLKDVLYH